MADREAFLGLLKDKNYESLEEIIKNNIGDGTQSAEDYYYFFIAQNHDYSNIEDYEDLKSTIYLNKALESGTDSEKEFYENEYNFFKTLPLKLRKLFCYVFREQKEDILKEISNIKKSDLQFLDENKEQFTSLVKYMDKKYESAFNDIMINYLLCFIHISGSINLKEILKEKRGKFAGYEYDCAETSIMKNKSITAIKQNIKDYFLYLETGEKKEKTIVKKKKSTTNKQKAPKVKQEVITETTLMSENVAPSYDSYYDEDVSYYDEDSDNQTVEATNEVDNYYGEYYGTHVAISSAITGGVLIILFILAKTHVIPSLAFTILAVVGLIVYGVLLKDPMVFEIRYSLLIVAYIIVAYVLICFVCATNNFNATFYVGIPILLVILALLVAGIVEGFVDEPEGCIALFVISGILSIGAIALGIKFIENEYQMAIMVNIPIIMCIISFMIYAIYLTFAGEEVGSMALSVVSALFPVGAAIMNHFFIRNNQLETILTGHFFIHNNQLETIVTGTVIIVYLITLLINTLAFLNEADEGYCVASGIIMLILSIGSIIIGAIFLDPCLTRTIMVAIMIPFAVFAISSFVGVGESYDPEELIGPSLLATFIIDGIFLFLRLVVFK